MPYTITDACTGNGPVDAVCNAIDRAIGIESKLVDFNVQAVTEGIDSQGTVTIRIQKDGRTYTGRPSGCGSAFQATAWCWASSAAARACSPGWKTWATPCPERT